MIVGCAHVGGYRLKQVHYGRVTDGPSGLHLLSKSAQTTIAVQTVNCKFVQTFPLSVSYIQINFLVIRLL